MKTYLAGPMSGLPDDNYPAFHSAAAKLRADGHEVFNPAEWTERERKMRRLGYPELIKRGIRAMLECERLVLLPGWEDSRGARVEMQIAIAIDMTVIHYAP